MAASWGASCSSGAPEPSHVLAAMGVAPAEAAGALRLSLGWCSTEADVDVVLAVLPQDLAILIVVMAVLDSTRVFRIGRAVALDVADTAAVRRVIARCQDAGVNPGYALGRDYDEHPTGLLVAITEQRTKEDIDFLADYLDDASNNSSGEFDADETPAADLSGVSS